MHHDEQQPELVELKFMIIRKNTEDKIHLKENVCSRKSSLCFDLQKDFRSC
jgi:hypothetical protein